MWHATSEVKTQRLQRFTVSVDQQGSFESERLWQLVSTAIKSDDQVRDTFCIIILYLSILVLSIHDIKELPFSGVT